MITSTSYFSTLGLSCARILIILGPVLACGTASPQDWAALASEAFRLEADGDYLGAEEIYGRILSNGFQLDVTCVTYASRGWLRLRMQRYAQALEDFDAAARRNSQLPFLLEGRSGAKRGLGDVEGALKDAQERVACVKADDPDYFFAYYERGISRRAAGLYDDAIADFSHCIDSARDHSCVGERGFTFALASNREAALKDLERAAASDPNFGYWRLWAAGLGGSMNLDHLATRTDWLGNVARFYMGRMSEEDLLKEADNTLVFQERLGRRCEAYTYIGLRAGLSRVFMRLM